MLVMEPAWVEKILGAEKIDVVDCDESRECPETDEPSDAR
jgi:hypothetical protein